jgi:serine/threonine protein kinase
MNKEKSLASLGIDWIGKPNQWLQIPKDKLPYSTATGKVKSVKGDDLFSLENQRPLGAGTFGQVDQFTKRYSDHTEEVAMKHPHEAPFDLLCEALFQWSLHDELKPYGLSCCVPKVYDIFYHKAMKQVYFTMECFKPQLLSDWCNTHLSINPKLFPLLLLQIALVLEVFEKKLRIDHRDLKINNILVLDEPVSICVGKEDILQFPFRVVFIDFGWACIQRLLDLREGDGLPPLDFCPKEGRDLFQVLVSIWSRQELRLFLEAMWGGWIRERIRSASPNRPYVKLAETDENLHWMYSVTDDLDFKAPLCSPKQIIQDCMKFIEK